MRRLEISLRSAAASGRGKIRVVAESEEDHSVEQARGEFVAPSE